MKNKFGMLLVHRFLVCLSLLCMAQKLWCPIEMTASGYIFCFIASLFYSAVITANSV